MNKFIEDIQNVVNGQKFDELIINVLLDDEALFVEVQKAFPNGNVELVTDATTLSKVIDKSAGVFSGEKDVLVLLASDVLGWTQIEYCIVNTSTTQEASALEKVLSSKVGIFNGENYGNEDVL